MELKLNSVDSISDFVNYRIDAGEQKLNLLYASAGQKYPQKASELEGL